MDGETIVIVAASRTPIGCFLGGLSNRTASQLGGVAIASLFDQTQLNPALVEEVLMGCVLSAGQGQAPARQAALFAGMPQLVGATTINKMCGSGMKASMMACDALKAGSAKWMVAGGMESMSQAPYLMPKARSGARLGHVAMLDHMFLDGLEDAYEKGSLMGVFAERCAKHFAFSREAQDAFALTSLIRAKQAIESGIFQAEITPVAWPQNGKEMMVSTDEQPFQAKLEKIPTLKPAFAKDGTVTAANSSSISDGAAALLFTTEKEAKAHGLTILAKILGYTGFAQAPEWFTTAPVGAMNKLLKQTGLGAKDVDLFEINEAFAVVTMAAIAEMQLDHARVNIYGGACALGHPIGASGARVLVTLLNALKQTNQSVGMASLCIGGGEATAMLIERVS